MPKNYLPSKIFIINTFIILAVVVFVFIFIKIKPFLVGITLRSKKDLTIKELVIKDSNTNGIPDWEETLWGLDPTKNGDENRTIILAKKAELNKKNGNSDSDKPLTKNEVLSRELLTLVVSLKQTNSLTPEAQDLIADEIGKQVIVAEPADLYTKKDIHSVLTTTTTTKAYRADLKKINDKYFDQDIGGELPLIAQALDNKDSQALKLLLDTGDAYKNFGEDLTKINVPSSLVEQNIILANAYNNTGEAILSMKDMIDDPLSGMRAIVQYKKYYDVIVSDIENIGSFFEKNGIIKL